MRTYHDIDWNCRRPFITKNCQIELLNFNELYERSKGIIYNQVAIYCLGYCLEDILQICAMACMHIFARPVPSEKNVFALLKVIYINRLKKFTIRQKICLSLDEFRDEEGKTNLYNSLPYYDYYNEFNLPLNDEEKIIFNCLMNGFNSNEIGQRINLAQNATLRRVSALKFKIAQAIDYKGYEIPPYIQKRSEYSRISYLRIADELNAKKRQKRALVKVLALETKQALKAE